MKKIVSFLKVCLDKIKGQKGPLLVKSLEKEKELKLVCSSGGENKSMSLFPSFINRSQRREETVKLISDGRKDSNYNFYTK